MISGRGWSEEETQRFMEIFSITPYNKLMRTFGRTKIALKHKADRLGLTHEVASWEQELEPLHLGGFDLGFIVGMLEGEGTVSIYDYENRSASVKVFWTNTRWELLASIKKSLNDWGDIYTDDRSGGDTRAPKHVYVLGKRAEIEVVLRVLAPFLITKKRQAELALEAIQLSKSVRRSPVFSVEGCMTGVKMSVPNRDRVKEIGAEIHKLNQRGPKSEKVKGGMTTCQ